MKKEYIAPGETGNLSDVLHQLDVPIYVNTEDHTLLYCSNAMQRLTGARLPRWPVPKCWKALYGRTKPCEHCHMQQLAQSPAGKLSWVERREEPLQIYEHTDQQARWRDGQKVYIHYILDITARVQAEEELRERQRLEQLVIDSATNFITPESVHATLSRLGKLMALDRAHLISIHEANRTYACISEWRNEGIASYSDCVGSNPVRATNYVYQRLLRNETILESNACDKHTAARYNAAGLLGVYSMLLVPVWVNKSLWGFLGVNDCHSRRSWSEKDIGLCETLAGIMAVGLARQSTEHSLFRAEKTLRAVLDHVPSAIIWKDANLRYLGCNSAFEAFSGLREEEIIGKTAYEAMPTELLLQASAGDHKVLATHQAQAPSVISGRDRDGQIRWIRVQRVPILNGYGGVTSVLGIYDDVTEEVHSARADLRRDEQREQAVREAERANAAKGDFLSHMSHEIRTPLQAIIGMSQVAASSDDPKQVAACLRRIDKASETLLAIINDVLDMSKIEADRLELVEEPFSIEEMLVRVYDVTGVKADVKSLRLRALIDPRLPAAVLGDEMRLSQVLVNLLSNAIKFTPEGGSVAVQAVMEEETEQHVRVRFHVIDSGVGIAPHEIERLFQPFEQANEGIHQKYGGTGLGLTIARHIVERMGGRLAVTSAPGRGSNFRFHVLLKRVASTQKDAQVPKEPIQILAASKEAVTRQVFEQLNRYPGMAVTVTSGEPPLQTLQKAQEGQRYNIVLWDIDGWDTEVKQQLTPLYRQVGQGRLVLLVEGFQLRELTRMGRVASGIQIMTKPLFPQQLHQFLLWATDVEEAKNRRQEPQRFAGRRILLAEDVAINREILCAFLEKTGVQITQAENGRQVVDAFRREKGNFDAVLMDIHMPEMDGFSATGTIRRLEKGIGARVPIIAMSADAFRKDVAKCLQAGMDAHLAKPIGKQQLLLELERWIGPQEKKRQGVTQHGQRTPGGEDDVLYLDVEDGLRRTEGNIELYQRLLRNFCVGQDLRKLLALWDAKKIPQLLELLHALKGVAMNLSLPRLQQCCCALENRLKNGGPHPEELVVELARVYRTTIETIGESAPQLALAEEQKQ